MAHKLAAGIVIIENEKVLLVKDKSGWSLSKGSSGMGETFLMAAEREAYVCQRIGCHFLYLIYQYQ
ncbi:NUDIX domain-containing protein [Paenibacillus sp. WC2504]|uniref:NUDIX domain-containing protein n=1 Tax=Paenibacillus sp. WC2504 TaxID=3461403 RepID=UPI00404623E0